MKVEYGVLQDIDSWMTLVERVRWNFPGLETQEKLDEHKAVVLRFMGKRQAICVKDGNEVAGVMLFSRGHNMICCLAVSPDYRRRGIASMLMDEALRNLDRTKEISVSTFRADDEKGPVPRAFYEKYGFVEDALIEEMGYPSQKYILYPAGCEKRERQETLAELAASWPPAVRKKIQGKMYSENTVGMSAAKVLMFPDMVLKIQPEAPWADREAKMLGWLEGRILAPKVIEYEKYNGMSYLLMTRIHGRMACNAMLLEQQAGHRSGCAV